MQPSREDVERIIAAVPNFRSRWDSFLSDCEAEGEPEWYVVMGELAHYVVENYAQGVTAEFSNLFSVVEALLLDPESELENLIAVGFFEGIQNIASHRDFETANFQQWLGPRSRVVWNEVDAGMEKVAAWQEHRRPRWWQFWRKPKTFDVEKALSEIESPDLRKIVESNFRKRR